MKVGDLYRHKSYYDFFIQIRSIVGYRVEYTRLGNNNPLVYIENIFCLEGNFTPASEIEYLVYTDFGSDFIQS